MTCIRCHSPMLHSCREEIETVDDAVLITRVFLNECPVCSALVKVVMPLLPGEQPLNA